MGVASGRLWRRRPLVRKPVNGRARLGTGTAMGAATCLRGGRRDHAAMDRPVWTVGCGALRRVPCKASLIRLPTLLAPCLRSALHRLAYHRMARARPGDAKAAVVIPSRTLCYACWAALALVDAPGVGPIGSCAQPLDFKYPPTPSMLAGKASASRRWYTAGPSHQNGRLRLSSGRAQGPDNVGPVAVWGIRAFWRRPQTVAHAAPNSWCGLFHPTTAQ